MRILVIEDDADTRAFVTRGLSEAGHIVSATADGREGLFAATDTVFDVLVVDRMLPGLDGLTLVRTLRSAGTPSAILMLTALNGIDDRVDGLNGGADDYLVKPFAFSELLARVTALGRRPARDTQNAELTHGTICIDLHTRRVTRSGQPIALQPREFALLAELMRRPDRIMTRTMLLERVWDFDFDPKTNIVETHISRLRGKLNAGHAVDAIETVRGAGYRLRPIS